MIGLDGISVGAMRDAIDLGLAPALGSLSPDGPIRIASSLPPVSSVAWSTFMTAANPGRHGIFGFTHPDPADYDVTFPNADDLRMPTLWDRAATDGLRSVVVNLPATYPARRIAGAMVAGFVAPRLDRACHPKALAERLERDGYVIDVDVGLARVDEAAFVDHVAYVLERRIAAMDALLDEESWSLAILTFTEADRLNHLAQPRLAAGDGRLGEAYRSWFRTVDGFVGRLAEQYRDATIVALSDHGFGPLERYLNLDVWLQDQGLLRLDGAGHVDRESRAFSMDPGRIYLNAAGMFQRGSVETGAATALAGEVAEGLLGIVDPETGGHPIAAVIRRRDAYRGSRSRQSPHLVCLPAAGYELKSSRRLPLIARAGEFEGTHTYDDAFFLAAGAGPRDGAGLEDAGATVLAALRLHDDDVDGRSLVR
ncbi:MAG TPA: alkaline phosphatase family protein [Candidatus Limnocylindrales bacterium]